MSTEKRHTQLHEVLSSHPLPQMDHDKMRGKLDQITKNTNSSSIASSSNNNNSNCYNYDLAAGLEGMSNESILLVDDTIINANNTNNVSNSYYTLAENAAVADNGDNDNDNDNEEEREHNILNNNEYNNEDDAEE